MAEYKYRLQSILDPPFHAKANYHVLFGLGEGYNTFPAQSFAFTDTWQWGEQAVRNYEDALTSRWAY